MSKDFRGASGQEQSCELKRIKSHTEKECLESRLKHGEWATIYSVTVQRVPDSRCSAAKRAIGEMCPGGGFL